MDVSFTVLQCCYSAVCWCSYYIHTEWKISLYKLILPTVMRAHTRIISDSSFWEASQCAWCALSVISLDFKPHHSNQQASFLWSWLPSQLPHSPDGVKGHFGTAHWLPLSVRRLECKSLLLYLFRAMISSMCFTVLHFDNTVWFCLKLLPEKKLFYLQEM